MQSKNQNLQSSKFVIAAECGDLNTVKELIAKPEAEVSLALMKASQNGHLEIVKLLIQDQRVSAQRKAQALIIASEKGQIEVVKLLLQDPKVFTENTAESSLNSAIQNGQLEIVKILLSETQARIKNYWLEPHIDLAVKMNNAEMVKVLLQDSRVRNLDSAVITAFYLFSEERKEVLELLLQDQKFKPQVYNQVIKTCLSFLINNKQKKGEVVQDCPEKLKFFLLDPRINPDAPKDVLRELINALSTYTWNLDRGLNLLKLLLRDQQIYPGQKIEAGAIKDSPSMVPSSDSVRLPILSYCFFKHPNSEFQAKISTIFFDEASKDKAFRQILTWLLIAITPVRELNTKIAFALITGTEKQEAPTEDNKKDLAP